MNRSDFLKKSALNTAALGFGLSGFAKTMGSREELYKISLAQWSLNSLLFSGEMDNLDFPVLTKNHGIDAVEYVNQFFMDKAEDMNYLRELKNRCDSEGVTSVLIMCDGEGQLGASDADERMQTVENHKKWVEAARFLGCHSIRVNAYSDIPWSEDTEAGSGKALWKSVTPSKRFEIRWQDEGGSLSPAIPVNGKKTRRNSYPNRTWGKLLGLDSC